MCVCVCVCLCVCVCVCVRERESNCVYGLRIVSRDKIFLRFKKTLIIIITWELQSPCIHTHLSTSHKPSICMLLWSTWQLQSPCIHTHMGRVVRGVGDWSWHVLRRVDCEEVSARNQVTREVVFFTNKLGSWNSSLEFH